MVLLTVILLLALVLSAIFSAAELAIFSLGDARVRALLDENVPGASALAHLREGSERLLALLRLGDTSGDVTAVAAGVGVGMLVGDTRGLLVTTGGVAIAIVLFGELIPVRIAVRHAVRVALT